RGAMVAVSRAVLLSSRFGKETQWHGRTIMLIRAGLTCTPRPEKTGLSRGRAPWPPGWPIGGLRAVDPIVETKILPSSVRSNRGAGRGTAQVQATGQRAVADRAQRPPDAVSSPLRHLLR